MMSLMEKLYIGRYLRKFWNFLIARKRYTTKFIEKFRLRVDFNYVYVNRKLKYHYTDQFIKKMFTW